MSVNTSPCHLEPEAPYLDGIAGGVETCAVEEGLLQGDALAKGAHSHPPRQFLRQPYVSAYVRQLLLRKSHCVNIFGHLLQQVGRLHICDLCM